MPPIASRTNPRVKQLRAAFANQPRRSEGLVAIEGEHLVQEALRSGLPLKAVFLSAARSAPTWLPGSIEIVELTSDVFASVVDTQAPQGIAALLAPPTWNLGDVFSVKSPETVPLLLIVEALQDPGNLGTLIRSAEAFAASAVLTLPGTVSPWNQKAIRASAGSAFRIPVIPITLADLATLKSPASKSGAPGLASETWDATRKTHPHLHLFAAVADADKAIPTSQANFTQPCALLIGNEGAGLSAELLALADTRVTIPTPGHVESLNAAIAGSLLLYEASRQRTSM